MYYKSANFNINNYTKRNNFKVYKTNTYKIDTDLVIIRLSTLVILSFLFIITNFIVIKFYNTYSKEFIEKQQYYNQLTKEYDLLLEEKNNLFSQKNLNEYIKKSGLRPPNDNQIIRLRD